YTRTPQPLLTYRMFPPPPPSPLLPYTTLFRSAPTVAPARGGPPCPPGPDSRSAMSIRTVTVRMSAASTSATRRGSHTAGTEVGRSEEHTSELQSLRHLVCRLLLEKKKHGIEFA